VREDVLEYVLECDRNAHCVITGRDASGPGASQVSATVCIHGTNRNPIQSPSARDDSSSDGL